VLILRWYWWRINAWSEIVSMITPFIVLPIAENVYGMVFPMTLYPIVAVTTVVWLVVTFLTSPVDREHLKKFYRKVHPGGIGWKKIAAELPDVKSDSGFKLVFVNWLFGVILIYAVLFGIGKLIFLEYLAAVIYLTVAAISVWVIYRNLSKEEFAKESLK
jgi:Na+/proline symporter